MQRSLTSVLVGIVLTLTTVVAPARAANDLTQPWTPGEPVFTAPSGTTPIVGVAYHGIWGDRTAAVRQRLLDELAGAGVQYVRLDVAWASLQPTSPTKVDRNAVTMTDQRIAEIAAHGMRTLLLLHWPPIWSSGTADKNGVPRSPDEFARVAAWAAYRWKSNLIGIEIMNEPDSCPSFLATTDPAIYTRTVVASYDRIKAVAPDVKVIAGAPTYVNTPWYERFFALGGAGHYDALGIHPYMGLSDTTPTTCNRSEIQYYPCNIPNLIALMDRYGDGGKGIWATEYGWSSHGATGYAQPVPNWKRGVSEKQQAQNLIDMQSLLSTWPQVQASFWYTAWNKNTADPQEDDFGLLTRDFRRKPAYYAMRCVASGVCGPQPVGRVKHLRVTSSHRHTARIRWHAPAGTTALSGYRTRWGPKKGRLSAWRTRRANSITLRGLKKHRVYRVQVAALSSAGTGKSATLRFKH